MCDRGQNYAHLCEEEKEKKEREREREGREIHHQQKICQDAIQFVQFGLSPHSSVTILLPLLLLLLPLLPIFVYY